jgi:hypothetical protein
VSATRHELRVFLAGRAAASPSAPTRRVALGLLTPEDHVRNSGTVRVDAIDSRRDDRASIS